MSMAVASQPEPHGFEGDRPAAGEGGPGPWARFRHGPRGSRAGTGRARGRSRGPSGGCRRPSPPSPFRRPARRRACARSSRPPARPCVREIRRRSSGVPGSGSSAAISAARAAASGRRAGQTCRVEIWPCRTFFSCTESSDACFERKRGFDEAAGRGGHGAGDNPAVMQPASNSSFSFPASRLESSNWFLALAMVVVTDVP